MKKIIVLAMLVLSVAFSSCDIRTKNSGNCKTRLDVQLMDGGAMWIYGWSFNDGYISGNDENGQEVCVPMHQVYLATEVACD